MNKNKNRYNILIPIFTLIIMIVTLFLLTRCSMNTQPIDGEGSNYYPATIADGKFLINQYLAITQVFNIKLFQPDSINSLVHKETQIFNISKHIDFLNPWLNSDHTIIHEWSYAKPNPIFKSFYIYHHDPVGNTINLELTFYASLLDELWEIGGNNSNEVSRYLVTYGVSSKKTIEVGDFLVTVEGFGEWLVDGSTDHHLWVSAVPNPDRLKLNFNNKILNTN